MTAREHAEAAAGLLDRAADLAGDYRAADPVARLGLHRDVAGQVTALHADAQAHALVALALVAVGPEPRDHGLF